MLLDEACGVSIDYPDTLRKKMSIRFQIVTGITNVSYILVNNIKTHCQVIMNERRITLLLVPRRTKIFGHILNYDSGPSSIEMLNVSINGISLKLYLTRTL